MAPCILHTIPFLIHENDEDNESSSDSDDSDDEFESEAVSEPDPNEEGHDHRRHQICLQTKYETAPLYQMFNEM